MTSATERIRAMLGERGVEYEAPHAGFTIVRTDNAVCKFYETLEEPERGVFAVVTTDWLTPEQAIAATLGATDARPTQAESSGTCHDEGDPSDFCCSACGVRMFTNTSDTYTMIARDGRTIIKHPNFCPNCGRRVEQ